MYFEDTDFDGTDGTEFMNIYHGNILITTCGSNNGVCSDYKYCLQKYQIGVVNISAGSSLLLRVEKGKDLEVPLACNYSLWADITLECLGTETESPTTEPTPLPTAETISPSSDPTTEPTDHPTSDPTGLSMFQFVFLRNN